MAIITVGSGEEYGSIEAAVAASSSGDTIDVNAGTYTNDFITINHSLTLQSVGGTVTLVATVPPPNLKGVIDEGGSGEVVTINGFNISGATISDNDGGNGAGIRYEGGILSLNNDNIHDNQDGLLANPDSAGTISINNSTFNHNGSGSGLTHNIYVNQIASFDISNSVITGAVVGHEIKSRAANTTITNNQIGDGPTGDASYEIDLPNGGNAVISGNTIEKGPNAQNSNGISFGEEGNLYFKSNLTVTNNVILNDHGTNSGNAIINDATAAAVVTNNKFYNWGNLVSGPSTQSGNTILTSESPCYAAGTGIATPAGEIAIEALRIGDFVATRGGVAKKVKWIGRRRYTASQIAAHKHLRPVVIGANALADGVPHRDLAVSAMHALFIDDVFVPAAALINGVNVRRSEEIAPVEYIHLELNDHDVIIAEGAPAESFVDDNSRLLFDNADEYYDRFGAEENRSGFSAPRVEEGYLLEEMRCRLARRAGLSVAAGEPGELRGHVERFDKGKLEGWVLDEGNPGSPVTLDIFVDGERVAHLPANRYRADLDHAGLAGGRCGFSVTLPASVRALGQISVRRAGDGMPLPVQPVAV